MSADSFWSKVCVGETDLSSGGCMGGGADLLEAEVWSQRWFVGKQDNRGAQLLKAARGSRTGTPTNIVRNPATLCRVLTDKRRCIVFLCCCDL